MRDCKGYSTSGRELALLRYAFPSAQIVNIIEGMALSLGGLGTPAGSFRRVKANKTMPGGIVENGALREMGKSALVIAGLGLGIVKIAQMKKLKKALAALERRTEALEFHASDAVTQRNIDSAIKEAVEEHARVSLHRFSQQEAFTEALRAMVSRTDELTGEDFRANGNQSPALGSLTKPFGPPIASHTREVRRHGTISVRFTSSRPGSSPTHDNQNLTAFTAKRKAPAPTNTNTPCGSLQLAEDLTSSSGEARYGARKRISS